MLDEAGDVVGAAAFAVVSTKHASADCSGFSPEPTP
jgi:hypothetical protein